MVAVRKDSSQLAIQRFRISVTKLNVTTRNMAGTSLSWYSVFRIKQTKERDYEMD